MIDPRIIAAMPKPQVTDAQRKVAEAIMSNRPLTAPEATRPPPMWGEPMQLDPAMQDMFDGLSPADQMLWEEEMQRGVDPADLYRMFNPSQQENIDDRGGRFNDAAAYQVADAGPMQPPPVTQGMAEIPAMGNDAVTARRLMDDEIVWRDALTGLSSVLEQLQENPEVVGDVHTWTGRAATNALRLRDRSGIDALSLDEDQQKRLGSASAYRQELMTRVNQYIKDITGAQMGEEEAKRLMAVQASPDDSPTELVAKLTNAIDIARMTVVRRKLMQRMEGPAPSDNEIRTMLRERGAAIYQELTASGLPPNEARMRAAQMLSQEYGF
jgi:hypothetical protein